MSDKLTYGQKAVGLSFNPSGDDKVAQVKQMYADIIDMMDGLRFEGKSWASHNFASTAITQALTAQMWAVKALTWKD